MRIRLCIVRPDLPPFRIWWPLQQKLSTSPKLSISNLFADVNDTFPLDQSNLGLEDYVAELDGCEVLHFSPITDVLRDGDELTYVHQIQTKTISKICCEYCY